MAIDRAPLTVGADPEAFLALDDKIIGSEKVLGLGGKITYGGTKIVCDGVQVEFQFSPGEDGFDVGRYVKQSISYFYQWLEAQAKSKPELDKCDLDWTECTEIPLEELLTLDEKSRELLCEPSQNIYLGQVAIEVPMNFPLRSAGGHIHLGLPPPLWNNRRGMYQDERRTLPKMLDWGVGSPCVLLNLGEQQRKRRTIYGRAGEYRLPDHGLEYRVPSNFWLRDPVLTQFVFGMAQFVVDIRYSSVRQRKPYDEKFMALFTDEAAREAIDQNDYGLALQNFEAIVPFIEEFGREGVDPLNKNTLPHFRKFLSVGIDEAFPTKTTEKRWFNWDETSTWEQFITKF